MLVWPVVGRWVKAFDSREVFALGFWATTAILLTGASGKVRSIELYEP
jgi:hypothetical protein